MFKKNYLICFDQRIPVAGWRSIVPALFGRRRTKWQFNKCNVFTLIEEIVEAKNSNDIHCLNTSRWMKVFSVRIYHFILKLIAGKQRECDGNNTQLSERPTWKLLSIHVNACTNACQVYSNAMICCFFFSSHLFPCWIWNVWCPWLLCLSIAHCNQ